MVAVEAGSWGVDVIFAPPPEGTRWKMCRVSCFVPVPGQHGSKSMSPSKWEMMKYNPPAPKLLAQMPRTSLVRSRFGN